MHEMEPKRRLQFGSRPSQFGPRGAREISIGNRGHEDSNVNGNNQLPAVDLRSLGRHVRTNAQTLLVLIWGDWLLCWVRCITAMLAARKGLHHGDA